MYYTLVHTSNYPPASEKKPEKEDKLIQDLYGQKEKKFSRLEQSLAAKLVNVVKNHKSNKKNDNTSNNNNNNIKSSTNWRYIHTCALKFRAGDSISCTGGKMLQYFLMRPQIGNILLYAGGKIILHRQ